MQSAVPPHNDLHSSSCLCTTMASEGGTKKCVDGGNKCNACVIRVSNSFVQAFSIAIFKE